MTDEDDAIRDVRLRLESATLIVQQARTEFSRLLGAFTETQDWATFCAKIDRWKERTTEALDIISPREAERFSALPLKGHGFFGSGTPLDLIEAHDRFLAVLLAEIEDHPDFVLSRLREADEADAELAAAVGDDSDANAVDDAPPRDTVGPELPERITVEWMIKRAPIHWWKWIVSAAIVALGSAFWLGRMVERYGTKLSVR